jgi:ribosomal protein S18 acetylase RimI-like enzyme
VPSFQVRVALPADVDDVFELLAAAGLQLAAHGFNNWVKPYPRSRIEADIAEGALFVVRAIGAEHDVGRLVATFALRATPVRQYDPAPWTDPDAPARYLNRLAVDPQQERRGIGRWCLARIAELSAAEGAVAVRCDVLAANERLCRFYEGAGYVARGTRGHSGWEFICYERELESWT